MDTIANIQRYERRFYLTTAVVFLALLFVAFGRTYYLKTFFDTPALPLLLHVHGVVMTGWAVLLVVQICLVAARRTRWHRRLGTIGAGWAALVVVLGSVTTIHAAIREVRGHTELATMQVFITGLELVQMVLFATLVAAAIALRGRTDYHKRLMILTVACLLPSVLARLPGDFMTNTQIMLGLDLFVVLCVVIDAARHRRLHPAFGWGGVFVLGSLHLAFRFMATKEWGDLGARLFA